MGEGLGRERGTGRARETAFPGDLVEHRPVAISTDHDTDRLEVLRGRPDHRRAADVDLLDHVVGGRSARDRLPEGVEVHDDEVEGIDGVLAELRHVVLVAAIGEQSRMDLRVERLHAPTQHLRRPRHFRDLGLSGDGVVSVAPDAGRAKVAVRFGEMIDGGFAIMHKTRPARDEVSVTEITGRVRDKVAIVGDDIITTGGTLLAGAVALREHGATGVWVFATHALFSGDALKRFGEADLAGIVVTDTVPIDVLDRPKNMTVLTVSGLLAETIMNVFADDSVSAIFGGENQLF